MKPTDPPVSTHRKAKGRLGIGFSTGTAVTAAAKAAMRSLLSGASPTEVSVRLPAGYFLPIPILECRRNGATAWATVVKDGGDDPDVTHKAELTVRVACLRDEKIDSFHHGANSLPDEQWTRGGVRLLGGEGVGVVTKAGLPVPIGEPAVNPVPRRMLLEGVTEELLEVSADTIGRVSSMGGALPATHGSNGRIFLPFCAADPHLAGLTVCLEISIPRGKELAQRTLNPRLGIVGGLSILGTTGLVKPYSHEAYQETIRASLAVAAANRCRSVVLSTGGRSERFAQKALPLLPAESFVQIADFFAFAVREAAGMDFEEIVHSAFFGKALKMAQGHANTHAHKVSMDLSLLARLARVHGYDPDFSRELEEANTARHALEILRSRQAWDLVRAVAVRAGEQSAKACCPRARVRLLLFDYDGSLLADVREEGEK